MAYGDQNKVQPLRPAGGVHASGGTEPPDVNERLGRLEAAIEGIRHSQNMLIAAVSIVGLVFFGLQIYMLQRMDALPADFERLSSTLAESITAARQTPPQVILVPAPQLQPLPQNRK